MASQKQIEANRRNAQRSTGPRTPEGKAASRHNALKHGLHAESLLVPGESRVELEELIQQYFDEYRPATPTQCYYVQTLITCDWLGRRYCRIQSEAFSHFVAEGEEYDDFEPRHAIGRTYAEHSSSMSKIFRQMNANQRTYERALAALRQLRREPSPEPIGEPASAARPCPATQPELASFRQIPHPAPERQSSPHPSHAPCPSNRCSRRPENSKILRGHPDRPDEMCLRFIPAACVASAALSLATAAQPTFDTAAKPLLAQSCAPCHNDRLASGGLDVGAFATPESLNTHREGWEHILQKVRKGEMPPKGSPRPDPAKIDEFVRYLDTEFERADRAVKPDPGRVTARRLNRSEYTNTIRDLLAVDFRADREFPTDDSAGGFDNIGDALSISPVLMEKYISAAERIAARAIGADPLPKPMEAEYHYKYKTVRRLERSLIEATHRIDWDGEYVIHIGLPGERAPDGKPVTLGFWMDGKLLHSMQVETKPSQLVYFNPYSSEQMRLYLPEGDHVFRAGFIHDEFVKTLTEKEAYTAKKNKYLESITFVGPFPAKVEKASRKKILVCDPNSGTGCVERIVSTLAHRAYRRPVTKPEVASLLRFVAMAQRDGQTVEQGIQLAIQAMLVSPHFLFRIERDPASVDAAGIHPISEIELASRLSYFLWSSMPDDELLTLAEAGKLRGPGVLDAQVKRMLADPRSSAFSANFAGQWLETRNLDTVKPDPQKFPDWGPELRDAMKTETRLFFDYILRENRPVSDFLDARYTFLNARLAKHYGIEGVEGPDFRRVELQTDQRGGILSQASVLTVSSYPTRTSVVIRGKYVLQNILGAPPPPPPADVPPLDEDLVGTKLSLRQQMEQHRSNAVCASCHNRMDTLGFGLENYDGIGKWRTMDGKFPVDSSGTLPGGKTFSNPSELRALLLQQELPDFARCLAEKLLTYSLGRGLQRFDRRTVEGITKSLSASDYRFQSLITQVVHSLPFQSRRAELREVAQK